MASVHSCVHNRARFPRRLLRMLAHHALHGQLSVQLPSNHRVWRAEDGFYSTTHIGTHISGMCYGGRTACLCEHVGHPRVFSTSCVRFQQRPPTRLDSVQVGSSRTVSRSCTPFGFSKETKYGARTDIVDPCMVSATLTETWFVARATTGALHPNANRQYVVAKMEHPGQRITLSKSALRKVSIIASVVTQDTFHTVRSALSDDGIYCSGCEGWTPSSIFGKATCSWFFLEKTAEQASKQHIIPVLTKQTSVDKVFLRVKMKVVHMSFS